MKADIILEARENEWWWWKKTKDYNLLLSLVGVSQLNIIKKEMRMNCSSIMQW